VLRKEVPDENLRALLNHEEPAVACIAAASLCGIRGKAKISDDIIEDWKGAIVRHVDKDQEHVLESLFPEHPDIAFDWIAWRLDGIKNDLRPFYFGVRYDRVLRAAVSALSREQRRRLIDALPRSSAVMDLVRSLVGKDIELFRHLLTRTELEGVRLDPLRLDAPGANPQPVVQEVDDIWRKMAIAAAEAGFSEEEVFSATQGGSFGWSGPLSSLFAVQIVPFEELSYHSDARLRKIGKIGVEHLSNLKTSALANEKGAGVR
jgi:hypothetical protein